MTDSSFKQEFIKMFQAFCVGLETINLSDYEEISSVTETDPKTGVTVRTAHLKKKDV